MPALSRRQRRMQQIHNKMEARRVEAKDAQDRLSRLQEEYVSTLNTLRDTEALYDRCNASRARLELTLSHPLHRLADVFVRAGRVLLAQLRAIRG